MLKHEAPIVLRFSEHRCSCKFSLNLYKSPSWRNALSYVNISFSRPSLLISLQQTVMPFEILPMTAYGPSLTPNSQVTDNFQPITLVNTNDIACNGGPNPTTPSSNIIEVTAGETVQATWRHVPGATPATDPTYVIDPSHLVCQLSTD